MPPRSTPPAQLNVLARVNVLAQLNVLARVNAPGRLSVVSPTWIWMQIAIVVFVVIGMIIAITKLV